MNLAARVAQLLHNPGQRAAAWYSGYTIPPDPDCGRCRRNPRCDGSDWCDPCRRWMRGDDIDDPKPPDTDIDWTGVTG